MFWREQRAQLNEKQSRKIDLTKTIVSQTSILVYKRGVKYLNENISSEESDLNGSENVEEDRQRAEVFDALSHPISP